MKKLMTEWRKFVLTEGMKTAADLPQGSGIAMISRGTNPMFVYTHDGKPLYNYPHPRFNPGVPEGAPWGEVLIGKLKPNSQGECSDAYGIDHSDTASGWGPLLYDVAMEWASKNGGGLTSDRGSVSRDAFRVWEYYLEKRPDVESVPLDIRNRGYEKITPDDKSDDCEQAISVKYARDTNSDPKWGWSAQPTAYLYRVSGTPTMDALEASGQLLELEQE